MKQTLLTLIMAFVAAMAAKAQILPPEQIKVPDLDSIYNEITDRTSPYYYPRLMEEFERNDTTMKLDKYRRLYLGAMFMEDYDAYRPSAMHESDPMDAINHSMLTREECDTIIKFCNAALQDNPFDLVRMINLSRALRARGRTALSDVWNYKIRQILLAILSTGTGEDEENAWYVIEPQHEYVLLNAMGLIAKSAVFSKDIGSPDDGTEVCEYVTITTPDGHDLGGVYFNIDKPLREYWRKNPEDIPSSSPYIYPR
ncbi:MAG: DUF4919 domain-containing protein [Pseudoflavonifractor sp.]|nr:DUF4919 domain-containing protein [Alloprevotella sp.]MCM1117570.1 DUF4919 domain-containing protein [Pseudoflavonifractor sp.]